VLPDEQLTRSGIRSAELSRGVGVELYELQLSELKLNAVAFQQRGG
jgi:hypothetical protein